MPNKSQARAIALIRRFVELDLNKNPEYGHQIVRFDVMGQDRLLVVVETLMTKLPDGNMLKALDHHHYHFQVGIRGRAECVHGPHFIAAVNNTKFRGVYIRF